MGNALLLSSLVLLVCLGLNKAVLLREGVIIYSSAASHKEIQQFCPTRKHENTVVSGLEDSGWDRQQVFFCSEMLAVIQV